MIFNKIFDEIFKTTIFIYGALSDMGYAALCDMVHFMIYCALGVEFFTAGSRLTLP